MKNGPDSAQILSSQFSDSAFKPVALKIENLSLLPENFQVPQYNPEEVKTTIFHIGPSNFARAQIAKMAHDGMNEAAREGRPLELGIKAVSLKSADVKHALQSQDNLYCLTSKGAGITPQHEVIGSIRSVICAKENAAEIIEAAADPSIKVITMTVTQNGYKPNESREPSKIIDTNNPEFSTIEVIVHSLNLRRERGLQPPVIMSLDNMNANATVLRNAVMEEASKVDPLLAEWIGDNVPFPSTMVDRITPSKSQTHIDEIAGLGVKDNWPVLAEPMPKVPLVIEDLSKEPGVKGQVFRNSGIQELTKVGAILSHHVEEYESMKLRVLNGTHMALGCVGTLCGYKTSDQAMADPVVRSFIGNFMDQAISTLKPLDGIDYKDFKDDVIRRLDNQDISDPLTRLARNGESKIKDRLLNIVRDTIADDAPNQFVTFAVASWLHYAGNLTSDGFLKGQNSGEPNDKDVKKTGLVDDINRNRSTINALFDRQGLWGQDLATNSSFIQSVKRSFESIERSGIDVAMKVLVGHTEKPQSPVLRKDLH